MKKYALLLGLPFFFLSPFAHSVVISEDFTGNTFDQTQFETTASGSYLSNNSWVSTNRAPLRTVADDIFGTIANPLTISAEVSFNSFSNSIAFIGLRSTGLQAGVYNELQDSVQVRMHNFIGDRSDLQDNAGLFTAFTPGETFYNSTVQVNIIDDGLNINVNFLNLATLQTFDIGYATTSSFGGYVAFSGDNVRWDNINISYGDTSANAVPEPSMLALMSLGLFGLGFTHSRKKKISV